MKYRWLNKLYAKLGGYFWLPCPKCGQYFGGHEWDDKNTVYNGPHGTAICRDCGKKISHDQPPLPPTPTKFLWIVAIYVHPRITQTGVGFQIPFRRKKKALEYYDNIYKQLIECDVMTVEDRRRKEFKVSVPTRFVHHIEFSKGKFPEPYKEVRQHGV